MGKVKHGPVMNYSFTEEQEQFRESVARFLGDKSPTNSVRRLMETDDGYDGDVWTQLCGELGLAGIHLPEKYGGAGFGAVELAIAMEEQGRALLCAPFLGSAVIAAYALLLGASDEQRSELLPKIVDGSTIGTLAISEKAGLWQDTDIQLSAERTDSGFSLNGKKRFVIDGMTAGLLIVVGRTPKGLSLFAVDPSAQGVERRPVAPMDPTRKIAEVSFSNTDGTLLGEEGQVPLEAIYNAVLIAFGNEMIGGAQMLLKSAVDYAGLRVQFGRTIGSFQAIKHRCADLHLKLELAKAAAYQAAQLLDAGEDATATASMAKATASDVYLLAAKECTQFHGGIGFTWENDTHLWFKRAKSSEVFLGTPAQHRERMLKAMGV